MYEIWITRGQLVKLSRRWSSRESMADQIPNDDVHVVVLPAEVAPAPQEQEIQAEVQAEVQAEANNNEVNFIYFYSRCLCFGRGLLFLSLFN